MRVTRSQPVRETLYITWQTLEGTKTTGKSEGESVFEMGSKRLWMLETNKYPSLCPPPTQCLRYWIASYLDDINTKNSEKCSKNSWRDKRLSALRSANFQNA